MFGFGKGKIEAALAAGALAACSPQVGEKAEDIGAQDAASATEAVVSREEAQALEQILGSPSAQETVPPELTATPPASIQQKNWIL